MNILSQLFECIDEYIPRAGLLGQKVCIYSVSLWENSLSKCSNQFTFSICASHSCQYLVSSVFFFFSFCYSDGII